MSGPSSRLGEGHNPLARQHQLHPTAEQLVGENGHSTDNSTPLPIEDSTGGSLRLPRTDAPASLVIAPSSLNQKTPARSFFHRSYHKSLTPSDVAQYSSQGVREQTAELASWALSDTASTRSGSSPPRNYAPSGSIVQQSNLDSYFAGTNPNHEDTTSFISNELLRPDVIEELPEATTPGSTASGRGSTVTSVLTEMLRSPPPDREQEELGDTGGLHDRRSAAHVAGGDETPRASESTPLLSKRRSLDPQSMHDSSEERDLEGQTISRRLPWRKCFSWPAERGRAFVRAATNPKSWNRKVIWRQGVIQPARYVPAVVLGLLLNILDALSYGMILFPLGQPLFAGLGPDGLSMFYVSCIVSQLVYSCGGSIFKGGVGSEMIEVVPFFHKMAFTILSQVGEENPKSVLATTILSYSISSVLTGLVFFLMGTCKLGSLIGFFPRHILIGCIGGVGWFLVATGLEVSARLDGNLEYNLVTLRKLFELDTVFLWLIPLLLAVLLITSQRFIKSPMLVPIYFLVIPAVFYFFVAVIPRLNLDDLRQMGWVFTKPEAGVPFYHFYTLYNFGAVDWKALASTIPAMFALTFFGILHVPINVPALGYSSGEDNVDVDRELIAHGVSNVLSGAAGSIQNYLVYTNSLLFMRSGGDSRIAGIMLAIGTFGIMVVGPDIIGFIPIMVVGALIFLLGIDLMREALYDTWGKVHRLEYLTIVVIVITMGAWDFVIGILVGIVLACVNFVVQTSQKSAVRANYTGVTATSLVRRPPVQHRFLREVGQQIYIAKLASFLFFGTIVSVEKKIRALIDEETFKERPIRFLVFDLLQVRGIDFSAAEAFTRINRILQAKDIQMIMCGVSADSDIGKSLRNVGLWDQDNEVRVFEDLNSALEYCENQLLEAFYHRRDALAQREAPSSTLDVPKPTTNPLSNDLMFSSPRRNHLREAAATTLSESDAVPHKWSSFKQPLPLILQVFHDLTTKNEDFWFKACQFFQRKEYSAGAVLFHCGDRPNGFYLLEEGTLRAEYDLPQGKYYESVMPGTTCGELPFFSETNRTATVSAETDCVAWLLEERAWEDLQQKHPTVAQELLRISLKLTSERMSAVTSYVLTTAG
ncbi:MAG: hypothetical protein M1819_000129 [Sarea resinae]|nr:MAG: hypothetical protein M1819_000129 [Sarea resinae]